MKNINPLHIQQVKDGVVQLGNLVEQLSQIDRTPDMTQIANAGISGDKINGGTITKFASTGIRDDSTRLSVVVDDNGILTDFIDVETLVGDTNVDGDLTVNGTIRAKKLHVDELSADVRQERSTSLEFSEDESGIYNKGLIWLSGGGTSQFVLRNNPDRLWSSLPMDIPAQDSYHIGGQPVLSATALSPNVRDSKLRSVGTLDKLIVQGNVNLSQFAFWDAESFRFGIGTEAPNAQFAVAGWDQEFVVDVDERATKLGNYTTHDLEIITDDTARIKVSATGGVTVEQKLTVNGKLGVGVKNVTDVDLAVAGPVRFENKKFEVGAKTPTEGSYRKGDIVWNSDPKPTGYVGWICTRDGTPGEWKPFGQIGA